MKLPRPVCLPWMAAVLACTGPGGGGVVNSGEAAAPSSRAHFTMGPQAGLRADLGPQGVAVAAVGARTASAGDAWAWRPTPVRWGCEGDLAAVPPAAPRASGGRVEYPREGITEWYVEGPRGLEQGFTLADAPACRRDHPSRQAAKDVVIELAGGLAASVVDGGRTAVLRDGAGREVMRYADLSVVDAAGRGLPAELRDGPGGLSIRFDDRGAVYPVTVDPLMWAQQGKLSALDGTGSDNFGWAVALSGDTAVLGAPDKAQGMGAAYVFARACGVWSQQQELEPPDGVPNQGFGGAVAIDGDTAIVGAQAAASFNGAAYVFVRSGGTWSELQTLTAGDGLPGDQLGSAVAIQGDTAIVGAPGRNGTQGALYVFTRSGGSWAQTQELTIGGGAAGDNFGSAVALDGDTAVVGAYGADMQRGIAWIFSRSGGSWTQTGQLAAGDASLGDQFGSAVAIAGGTAIVGAYEKASAQGAAYVFALEQGTWTKQQELTAPSGVAGDRFGYTVAIGGSTAIVGAPVRANSTGAAYVFGQSGTSWPLLQTLGAGDGATGDSFGYTSAISGTSTLVGALYSANNQGAAYVFVQGGADAGTCGSGSGSGSGSGNGGAGGGPSNTGGGGAGSAVIAHDLKDHIPFAFGGCGCRAAGQGGEGLGALAVAALAAGFAARRRRG